MATTVLYRKSSGEVLKISIQGQVFDNINGDYYGYLTDPDLPDGTNNRNILPDGTLGPLREAGAQKIAIPSAALVRDAEQFEIDGFEAYKIDDDNLQDATGAADFLENHKRFRKIFKAILKLVVINQLLEKTNVKQNAMIDQWNQYKTDVAGIANLTQFKSVVANLPTITSNLVETATLSDIKDAVIAEISKDE